MSLNPFASSTCGHKAHDKFGQHIGVDGSSEKGAFDLLRRNLLLRRYCQFCKA